MPESEARASTRARAKPQRGSQQRTPLTDLGQKSSGSKAAMEEAHLPGESLPGRESSQSAFERHAALLGDIRLSHPANASVRIQVAQQLQQDYGNQYVQRLVKYISRQRTETSSSLREPPLAQAAEPENQSGEAAGIKHHSAPGEPTARETKREIVAGGQPQGGGRGFEAPSPLGEKQQTNAVAHSDGSRVVQRLIRSPYPWQGVITPARGANLRSSPDTSDPSNIEYAIPQGETVEVISNTGNWLRVESRYKGPALVGYIYHTLVDDATSASMESSVGTTMVWEPSGPGSGTDFESWASAPVEAPFPAVSSTTVMNCWEAVLLAAYRSGSIDWNWIHNMYTSVSLVNWVSTMSRGGNQTYAVPGPNQSMPQRGDLVFFDGMAHVALATGNGSDVYTFWPPPNTPFTPGGTTDNVKVFTIEHLVTWWTTNMPPAPTVEFGAPSW